MKKLLSTILGFTVILFFLYYYLKQDFEKTTPTIYYNGNIITLEESRPTANAMFVEDGKIKAIGSAQEIATYKTDKVAQVDLKGATVMPGFIDPHTHFGITMFLSKMHDLSGFTHKSNQEVWESFELSVKQHKEGEWVICKGIDPILVGDLIPPSIQYLDKVAPNNPVLIFSQSLHSYWANSKAFEEVGITTETPNPSDHSYYDKDSSGAFTGLIVEQEAIKPFTNLLKDKVLTPKVLGEMGAKVMSEYAKNGNTTIVTTGATITDSKPLMLFEHLSAQEPTLLGGLLTKIGMFPQRKATPRHFVYMRNDVVHLLPEKKGNGDDFYDIIGVKLWYDGSPYIGSMYLNEPYKESKMTNETLEIPHSHAGHALVEKDSLKHIIQKYHQQGWQIAIHTQGDAATNEVLDVFESLNGALNFSESKHRLEHCLLLSTTGLERMKNLNITPSFHINHLYYYGDALKSSMLGEDRVENILPLGAAQDMAIKYSLHADQPMFESDPFRLMQTAIERQTISGDSIGVNQKINLMEAVKALTINAAWQFGMEDKIGSLKEGKYADFIILDRNPFETPTHQLEQIECVKTYVNGNLVL
ncbi:amidohydrolase [Limibacter armeniacum]|uniref:amidohydrolase n=1 Tax=Limibacter armeniacum TaxID=466084 RepID=UPI002FE679B2